MLSYFVRYFLRVTIVRRLSDVAKELDIAVHTLSTYPEMNTRYEQLRMALRK
jgi:vacuolar protein sorting-associated protein 26